MARVVAAAREVEVRAVAARAEVRAVEARAVGVRVVVAMAVKRRWK